MGKKKVKPNAFSVFMHEYLDKERQKGRRYPKEQWATVAKPHFEKLTPDQKESYKQKAKRMPVTTMIVPPKYTSHGIPLEQIEREQREALEKKRYMERKVKHIVENGFLDNDIATRPFYFIMANYFYKTSDSMYSPAEIAMAKFNFEDAIFQSYHSFINPETVRIGYAFEAKDRSERYHRLTPPPNAIGEKRFDRIYAGILDVMGVRSGQTFEKDDPRRPCVFIRKEDVEMIESILDQLSDKQWTETFDIFDLELLFYELKNKVSTLHDRQSIPITVTSHFIEKDSYDATPNISCDFHETEDRTRYCALSYVRRWFFLFADHICQSINVKLVAGKHLPINAALDPPPKFDDDSYDEQKPKTSERNRYSDDDGASHTGYSRFQDDSDSSDSDY